VEPCIRFNSGRRLCSTWCFWRDLHGQAPARELIVVVGGLAGAATLLYKPVQMTEDKYPIQQKLAKLKTTLNSDNVEAANRYWVELASFGGLEKSVLLS
jgi:hypothetical protein